MNKPSFFIAVRKHEDYFEQILEAVSQLEKEIIRMARIGCYYITFLEESRLLWLMDDDGANFRKYI